ncbi:hypothetical protein PQX77_005736 [Marasmius sp. AFHP31]|nr:hypothetical protein PQX77_005736 [Marasmius sp. AFHP31]
MEVDEEIRRLQQILYNDSQYSDLLQQTGDDAQSWLDLLQLLVDHPKVPQKLRSSILVTILRLVKTSGLHPKCLTLQNVRQLGDHPVAGGAFGDVWKGLIGDSHEVVCLKVVKVYLASDVQQLLKDYLREAIVWKQLKHPNLLPFLGIFYLDNSRHKFCLVSPWMERGNLVQFIKASDPDDVPRHSLAYDIAAGLAYLHSKKIVHGDLKGVNVLVTPERRACIGDFGLSRIADASSGLMSMKSTTRPAGTARWLAPELVMGNARTSEQSDIYAYGGIFAGHVPFFELPNDAAVVLHVLQGARPTRPADEVDLHDGMWMIMEACWNADPSSRLSAADVLALLIDLDTLGTIEPAPDWNDNFTEEIWNNLRRSTYDSKSVDDLMESLELASDTEKHIGRTERRERQHNVMGEAAYRGPVSRLEESPEHSSPEHSPPRSDIYPSSIPSDPSLNVEEEEVVSALMGKLSFQQDPNTSDPDSESPKQRSASPPIISMQEDMKRMFEECEIGRSSAISLAQALSAPVPEAPEQKRRWRLFLKEYHSRCLSSREIVSSQIQWATATAHHSRRAGPESLDNTPEEELLAELLAVNETLGSVLERYDDTPEI